MGEKKMETIAEDAAKARTVRHIQNERERCAKIAEAVAKDCTGDQAQIARHIARLIRKGTTL